MGKLKEKIRSTEAAKIWAKNSAETKAEREQKKSSGKVKIAVVRFIQAFMIVVTVYAIAVVAVSVVIPTVTAYLAGAAGVTDETSIVLIISTWLFPALVANLLICAGALFLIKMSFRMWNKCFGGIVAKIKEKAAAKAAETGSEPEIKISHKTRSKKAK